MLWDCHPLFTLTMAYDRRALSSAESSPIRLPAVDAMLTELGLREWPPPPPAPPLTPPNMGDALDELRVCFTAPSAILLREGPEPTGLVSMSTPTGIFSWAAANCESWSSCDSWLLELLVLAPSPLPPLTPPSLALAGGVNATLLGSESLLLDTELALVSWALALEFEGARASCAGLTAREGRSAGAAREGALSAAEECELAMAWLVVVVLLLLLLKKEPAKLDAACPVRGCV